MDLFSKSIAKQLLENAGVRPLKKLGQNFLISRTILNKIIKTANLEKTDIILEIGPGIGTLTKELAKTAKKVIAIEKDKKMIEILKQTLKDFKNIEIIHADILKLENVYIAKLLNCSNYKIVANLPYYITSPIIKKFLEIDNPPLQMILMVQKQVAQRICAKPPRMNLLAVSVQFYSHSKIISYVSKNCFWPSPKVDSAIIKIILKKNLADKENPALFREGRGWGIVGQSKSQLFFKIVRAGFSHPRKQLVNNLTNGLALSMPNGLELEKPLVENWLLKNNIQPSQRAQTLYLKDWINLTNTFSKIKL